MSKLKLRKLKLRKQSKVFSDKLEDKGWLKYWYLNKKTIKLITNFDCENNFTYLNAIINYNTIKTFKLHNLWVEHKDANTSSLFCEFNKDDRVLRDLSPFWDIYYLIKSGEANHITLANLIRKVESEYDYSVPLTSKDRYKKYRQSLKFQGEQK